jgi:hypothetical protein
MSWLCCILLSSQKSCMHACMHASSLTLPTMHACVIYSLSAAWLWWLRYRHFGAKMVYDAVYTCQYTSSTSDSHCHDCLLDGDTPISPCCHAFYSRVLAIPWHYDNNCALCVYSNSRETSKFVVDGGVTRNSTKMMGSSARIALALLYLIAYVFAGKANKVGQILSSEKDA